MICQPRRQHSPSDPRALSSPSRERGLPPGASPGSGPALKAGAPRRPEEGTPRPPVRAPAPLRGSPHSSPPLARPGRPAGPGGTNGPLAAPRAPCLPPQPSPCRSPPARHPRPPPPSPGPGPPESRPHPLRRTRKGKKAPRLAGRGLGAARQARPGAPRAPANPDRGRPGPRRREHARAWPARAGLWASYNCIERTWWELGEAVARLSVPGQGASRSQVQRSLSISFKEFSSSLSFISESLKIYGTIFL